MEFLLRVVVLIVITITVIGLIMFEDDITPQELLSPILWEKIK